MCSYGLTDLCLLSLISEWIHFCWFLRHLNLVGNCYLSEVRDEVSKDRKFCSGCSHTVKLYRKPAPCTLWCIYSENLVSSYIYCVIFKGDFLLVGSGVQNQTEQVWIPIPPPLTAHLPTVILSISRSSISRIKKVKNYIIVIKWDKETESTFKLCNHG
jgi:hypothetical protein